MQYKRAFTGVRVAEGGMSKRGGGGQTPLPNMTKSKLVITCSKLTLETLEQVVNYVQS